MNDRVGVVYDLGYTPYDGERRGRRGAFVTTVNAYALRGAKPVFVDVRSDTLNLDEKLIEERITDRIDITKPAPPRAPPAPVAPDDG